MVMMGCWKTQESGKTKIMDDDKSSDMLQVIDLVTTSSESEETEALQSSLTDDLEKVVNYNDLSDDETRRGYDANFDEALRQFSWGRSFKLGCEPTSKDLRLVKFRSSLHRSQR
jgi:hypothetical protein